MTVRQIVTDARRDGDAAVRRCALELELDDIEPHRARATGMHAPAAAVAR